jgi:hypothetical protein
MKIAYFLFCILFLNGCAHYFADNFKFEEFNNSHSPTTICIEVGEFSIRNEKNVLLDESHATHGKIITKIKQKYPQLVYDCSASSKTIIYYTNIQEKKKLDYFILSLGIIPLIAKTDYVLKVKDQSQNKVYESKLEGHAVMSFFFVPFFFLHRHDYEIAFDEIDKYLQIHLNRQNNLR